MICTVSGAEPSSWCPQQKSEIFASDQLPIPSSEDLWKKINLDTWTGLEASEACSEYNAIQFVINVEDEWAQEWLKNDPAGQAWAEDMGFSDPLYFLPERACKSSDPQPTINLTNITDGQTISSSPLEIKGIVTATENFDFYRIDWGRGAEPTKVDRFGEEDL